MKKFISMAAAVMMTASLAACSSSTSSAASKASSAASSTAEATESAEAEETAKTALTDFKITNNTGENVKELYVFENGSSDKGENYATDAGLADGSEVEVNLGEQDYQEGKYTLEYVTESGRDEKFETLSTEEANISLISEDAMTGSTPIQFVTE